MKYLILPYVARDSRRSMSDAHVVQQDIARFMRTRAGATPATLAKALERLAYKVSVFDEKGFVLSVDGYVFDCAGTTPSLVA